MQNLINTIIHGDCIEKMSLIDDNSIDLILTDLPYGVTARNEWDKIIPFDKLWKQYKRISKPNTAIILTATQPFASQLICSNYEMFKYDLIWVKNKPTGFLNAKKMPLRQHELILVFYNELPIYNPQKTSGHNPVNSFTKHHNGTNYGKTKSFIKGGGQTDRYPISVICCPVINNDNPEKFHSTQKPVELFEELIKTFSNPNDLVLDSCIGSGTTAIAAISTGRRFIGIESNRDFVERALERICRFEINRE